MWIGMQFGGECEKETHSGIVEKKWIERSTGNLQIEDNNKWTEIANGVPVDGDLIETVSRAGTEWSSCWVHLMLNTLHRCCEQSKLMES